MIAADLTLFRLVFMFLSLRNRFIFMAVINAIFAPFIVLYLLFYSFFRYFEVSHASAVRTRMNLFLDLTSALLGLPPCRSTTRTRRISVPDSIHNLPAGNFASSTNYHIYLGGGATTRIRSHNVTSNNFPESGQQLSPGMFLDTHVKSVKQDGQSLTRNGVILDLCPSLLALSPPCYCSPL